MLTQNDLKQIAQVIHQEMEPVHTQLCKIDQRLDKKNLDIILSYNHNRLDHKARFAQLKKQLGLTSL